MKGFKGYSKDFSCKGKQYTENTVYEEEVAKICDSGFHFCEHPFDVWTFYPPCDGEGNFNTFSTVEALADVDTDDGMKYCTKRIEIGDKIDFGTFVSMGIKDILDNSHRRYDSASAATNTGNRSVATNTGDYSAATNTGDYSAATNTGDYSAATNTGDCSAAINTSYHSVATNTGHHSAATNTGTHSVATNTGHHSAATNTGEYSVATNTGDYSAAINTSYHSVATVNGKNSIAITTGADGIVRGSIGSWIVCTERLDSGEIIAVKAAKVDGITIKDDVFYSLKNGEFIEVK